MFILSEEQFKRLLTFGGFNVNRLSAINNEISILGTYLFIFALFNGILYEMNAFLTRYCFCDFVFSPFLCNRTTDIGAGDGEVTMRLVKGIVHMKNNIFLKVFATEYSWTMRERLQEKKFM